MGSVNLNFLVLLCEVDDSILLILLWGNVVGNHAEKLEPVQCQCCNGSNRALSALPQAQVYFCSQRISDRSIYTHSEILIRFVWMSFVERSWNRCLISAVFGLCLACSQDYMAVPDAPLKKSLTDA